MEKAEVPQEMKGGPEMSESSERSRVSCSIRRDIKKMALERFGQGIFSATLEDALIEKLRLELNSGAQKEAEKPKVCFVCNSTEIIEGKIGQAPGKGGLQHVCEKHERYLGI